MAVSLCSKSSYNRVPRGSSPAKADCRGRLLCSAHLQQQALRGLSIPWPPGIRGLLHTHHTPGTVLGKLHLLEQSRPPPARPFYSSGQKQSTDGHGALCPMSSCTNRHTNRHFCPQTGRQKGTVDGGGDETRTPGDDNCSLRSPEVEREREITTENHRAEGWAMERMSAVTGSHDSKGTAG